MAVALLSVSACELKLAQKEMPALIDHPTSQSRAELKQIVSTALNGAPILLADDALTRESVLIVERVRPRDAHGILLNGRELERPEHFRLVKSGKRCFLVHEHTSRYWPLRSTACRAPHRGRATVGALRNRGISQRQRHTVSRGESDGLQNIVSKSCVVELARKSCLPRSGNCQSLYLGHRRRTAAGWLSLE